MTASMDTDTRSTRLKGLTTGTHDRLDRSIMAGDPFADVENYAKFLKVQYLFHRDIGTLYDVPELAALLPDLEGRRRFDKVVLDLSDVGADAPEADGAPRFVKGATVDLPTALGWLYVAEGSNLGAAFLLKFAAKLGLDATKGARHLAPADEGRGLHWRTFTAALDAIDLTAEEEARVTAGAGAAFTRVHGLVRRFFDGV
ncbi:biliverdin-producing heme oxygenase [Asticcacaulis sp. AND118]|uniref:biliverdin-producing heme oxygenase n=1 Tax=Asticcacaulis sp. AND118 TaxID=2840468 RepID=UPI001CFFA4B8|nr:biliverdin-producing heme oxygenase [Asticcacaulis sp. AND118]UDF04878.1 biliverdin-producing heme oxygenase [Asticcacaulis sp. AND118]